MVPNTCYMENKQKTTYSAWDIFSIDKQFKEYLF